MKSLIGCYISHDSTFYQIYNRHIYYELPTLLYINHFVEGLQLARTEGVVPIVAVSPVVSHVLPVCVRLQIYVQFFYSSTRLFLLIGLYQSNNGSATVTVLGQITKKGDGVEVMQQHQVTLPPGTYRFMFAAYNHEKVNSVVVKDIAKMDGECADDGKRWFLYRFGLGVV